MKLQFVLFLISYFVIFATCASLNNNELLKKRAGACNPYSSGAFQDIPAHWPNSGMGKFMVPASKSKGNVVQSGATIGVHIVDNGFQLDLQMDDPSMKPTSITKVLVIPLLDNGPGKALRRDPSRSSWINFGPGVVTCHRDTNLSGVQVKGFAIAKAT